MLLKTYFQIIFNGYIVSFFVSRPLEKKKIFHMKCKSFEKSVKKKKNKRINE